MWNPSPSLRIAAPRRDDAAPRNSRDEAGTHDRGPATSVSPRELRRAIRQAEILGLPIGAAPADRTRSELEYLFLRLCRRHRLPAPETNARVGSLTVDFLWREKRLIIETDGYRYHRGRAAFEDDRSRDLELRTSGFDVMRLSYRQVVEEPERIAGGLRRLLRDMPE